MRILNKITGLLLALCLTAGLLPASAFALASPVYLALGDSISTGYGLADPDSGFVGQIASYYPGYTLVNHAVNGNTAAGVYDQIKDGALDDALIRADLITLTCGGNDMMAILYAKIAMLYNAEHPDAPISPTEVTAIMGGTHETLDSDALTDYSSAALTGLAESEEFDAGLAAYEQALTDVMTYIRAVNPDACVVIPTQYNPYRSFQVNLFYAFVYPEMERGAQKLNGVITGLADELGYITADVHAVFAASEDALCNARVSPLAPLVGKANFDFHPNAAGHTVLAQTILALNPGSPMAETAIVPDGEALTITPPEHSTGVLVSAALYNETGRMMKCVMESPSGPMQSVTLRANFADAAAVRVFLLEEGTFVPLCRELILLSE